MINVYCYTKFNDVHKLHKYLFSEHGFRMGHVRWVPLSPQHGVSSGCGWRGGLQQWTVAANILNKQQQTNNPSAEKTSLLRKIMNSLGPGWILWINNPSDRIWT
jgi:hypothetical protein